MPNTLSPRPKPDRSPKRQRAGTILWSKFGIPFLVAAGVMVLFFTANGVVEQWWFADLDLEARQWSHMMQGIISSLVVAIAVGWMFIKTSPSVWDDPIEGNELNTSAHIAPEDRERAYARWFIAMRWIAVVFATCLVFISVRLVHWLPEQVWWPLMGAVVTLAALNVAYTLLLRRSKWDPRLLPLQAYLDLGILTTLLHFSGGIENPLSMMMLFHVIIGGILLTRRQCYGIAAVASLLFAVMAWAEWGEFIDHYTLQIFPHGEHAGGEGEEAFHLAHHSLYVLTRIFLQWIVLFLSGYFVTTLAERLRQNERRLEIMADRATAGQQLLEQSLETTGTALRVMDVDRKVVWSNLQWRDWFEDLTAVDQRAASALDGQNCPAKQTVNDGETRVTELVLGGNGEDISLAETNCDYRVYRITTARLIDPIGEIHRVVELAQDITDQKRAQAQMMRAGKLAAVGELAGRVAHEVNNPIAIISTKMRLLLSLHRADMSDKIADEISKSTEQADRVARIAQGLLSYCRPSPATLMSLDVRKPMRKSLSLVEQHAAKAGVTIVENVPDSIPAIRANAGEVEQVFLNLFINALDAMPDGGTLTIDAEANSTLPDGRRCIAVHVRDTGSGISSEIRPRIFEPFFTTKLAGHGTGLGLSICQGLIRSQGGEIQVRSEPNEGTVFTIKLLGELSEKSE